MSADDAVLAKEELNTVIDDVCEVKTYGDSIDAVTLVGTYNGANDAVLANEALVAFKAYDADVALVANEALVALSATEDDKA